MPVNYIEISILCLLAAFAIFFVYDNNKRSNKAKASRKILDELLLLSKEMGSEYGIIYIPAFLRDGSRAKFLVRLDQWVMIGTKSRMKGLHYSTDSLKILLETYEDSPSFDHRHFTQKTVTVLDGKLAVYIDEKKNVLSANDMLKIPAGSFHRMQTMQQDGRVYAKYTVEWP